MFGEAYEYLFQAASGDPKLCDVAKFFHLANLCKQFRKALELRSWVIMDNLIFIFSAHNLT